MVTDDKVDQTTPFRTQAEADQVPDERKALVKRILKEVCAWKEHHKHAFLRMKRNVKFVMNAGNEQWRSSAGVSSNDDRYVANITHRFIQQKVSSLYARDPRVKAKRRPMIDGVVWDGRQETLDTAMMTLGMGGPQKGPPPDPKIEIEKAKLELAGNKEMAAAKLAQEKQAADVADQQAGRAIEQQKLQLEAKVKMGELDIRRQEAAVKLKELGIKQQELGIKRAALASDNHNKGMDRNAKVDMNRESIGAKSEMNRESLGATAEMQAADHGQARAAQAADHQHDTASQAADHSHASETVKGDRKHDSEKQKRDLDVKKTVAKKKGPTSGK